MNRSVNRELVLDMILVVCCLRMVYGVFIGIYWSVTCTLYDVANS